METLSLTLALSASIDDAFILYLFQVIEGASDDPNDPYHYPVIRVLVHIDSGVLELPQAC
jgi:hypothetical protein